MDPAPTEGQSTEGQSPEGQSLQGQVIDWLMRLEAAPDDPALRGEFERWLSRSDSHRRAYAAVELVWGSAGRLAPLTAERREAARAARPWRRLRRRTAVLAVTAIAACIAFFAVPALQLRLSADHITETAELSELVLDDGSRITLDGGSAVAVDYTPGRRTVRLLAGQAFFAVTPSPQWPFVVSAGAVEVTVTGTAFDVATSRTGVAVSVQSGSVNITRNGGETLAALSAGQRLKVGEERRVGRATIDPGDVGAWRDRRVVVYDVPLRDVVEQIGRHMSGVVIFADAKIADSLVSGIVDLERPADALRALVDLQQGRVTSISPYVTVISSP